MEKEWDNLVAIYNSNPIGWSLASGVLGASIVVCLHQYGGGLLSVIPDAWRGMMAKKARRELVRQQAADDFVSSIMERVDEGTFSLVEANELYRDLKKCFPISALYASPEKLKEDIQKRLQSGMHAPVPLSSPDVPKAVKHMFDGAKPKLKMAS